VSQYLRHAGEIFHFVSPQAVLCVLGMLFLGFLTVYLSVPARNDDDFDLLSTDSE
jgi:hypothetical protein